MIIAMVLYYILYRVNLMPMFYKIRLTRISIVCQRTRRLRLPTTFKGDIPGNECFKRSQEEIS